MVSQRHRRKNRIIALFLSLLLGFLGIDRFYLGKPITAIVKALTLGGVGLWWMLDLFLLGLDAFLYTFGKDSGFVKDGNGQDLAYGLAFYRIKNGKLIQDWFSGSTAPQISTPPVAETITQPATIAAPQSTETAATDSLKPEQNVNEIIYTVVTPQGSETYRYKLAGARTSTITLTVGKLAGAGRFVANLEELKGFSSGTRICFNGKISSLNVPLIYNLVAYINEEFHGMDAGTSENGAMLDDGIWRRCKVETPQLLIELPDGLVPIVNNDYGLTFRASQCIVNGYLRGRPIYHPQADHFICNEITAEFSQRFFGLELGDDVVVVGTIEQPGENVAIAAENINISR